MNVVVAIGHHNEVTLSGFSTLNLVSIPPLPYCTLWKEISMHKYLRKLFEILLHGRLVSSPSFINLLSYFYLCGLLDTNFILRVVIQY